MALKKCSIPIKFVIGHRRILGAKRPRGHPKGGLDPLGSSDDGKIEAPPPPARGKREASCRRLRVFLICKEGYVKKVFKQMKRTVRRFDVLKCGPFPKPPLFWK